jgi:hypothetical protein
VAAKAKTVADEVLARARGLNAYLGRIERLYSAGELSRTDVQRAYAGAFLTFHAFTERSLERLFLGAVMGRFEFAGQPVATLINVKSEVVLRQLVASGRKYADWLPYESQTAARAPAFLASGRPFVSLAAGRKEAFLRQGWIRNAIAHESSYAIRQFRRHFVDGKALPPEQKSPQGYLRGQHSPGKTRFEFLVSDVVQSFTELCA